MLVIAFNVWLIFQHMLVPKQIIIVCISTKYYCLPYAMFCLHENIKYCVFYAFALLCLCCGQRNMQNIQKQEKQKNRKRASKDHSEWYCAHTDIKFVVFCVLWLHTLFAVAYAHVVANKICHMQKQEKTSQRPFFSVKGLHTVRQDGTVITLIPKTIPLPCSILCQTGESESSLVFQISRYTRTVDIVRIIREHRLKWFEPDGSGALVEKIRSRTETRPHQGRS